MTFSHPWALALLALVPLLWLVRHKAPRRRVLVAAPAFWTSSPQPDTPWRARTLARHPLVWIQTALAVALILALAGPRVAWGEDGIALVLDTSMSMGAREGAGTRLDAAKDRARAIVRAQPASTRVRVWAAGGTPSLLGDGLAGGGLPASALSATDGWADLESAVSLAMQGAPRPRRVYVISDRPTPVRGAVVEWVPVGSPVDNVALSSLVAWRSPDRPDILRVSAHIRNHGTNDARATLTASFPGLSPVRRLVAVAAGRTAAASLTMSGAPLDGVVTATLDVDDGLRADNVRYAVVRQPAPIRVGLSGASRFLEAALRAHPAVALVNARSELPEVLVCVACTSTPAGDLPALVIPPPPTSPLPPAPITVLDAGHPIVADVALDGIAVAPQGPSVVSEGAVVVARAGGAAVLVARESGDRRVVELRLDPTDPRFALSTDFPLLMSGILDWLVGERRLPSEVRAGDSLVWSHHAADLPEAQGATAAAPNGRAVDLVWKDGRLILSDTSTAGLYSLRGNGRSMSFVVNPATREESNLSPAAAQATPLIATAETAVAEPPARATADLTTACLVIAVLLLLLEVRVRYTMIYAASGAWPWPRLATRGAAAVLVLAALARLSVWTGAAPLAVAFVLDRSDSAAPAWLAFENIARRLAQSLEPSDQVGLTVFGASSAVERRVQPGALPPGAVESQIDGAGTNLQQALRTARASLPPGGDRRLVLLSDGRETTGDAEREVMLAAADGVRIDVVPPPSTTRPMARASRVAAPTVVRQGEAFEVRVVVEGPVGTTGRLQLLGTGEPREQTVAVPAAGSAAATFAERAQQPGVLTYRALFTPDDSATDLGALQPSAPQAGAAVAVIGPLRVLVIGENGRGVFPLSEAGDAKIDRRTVAQLPAAAALAAYDAVVLDDVSPTDLRPAQRSGLAQYVELGGGLLVLGSERSLPPNATGDSAFDALLPVDARPRSGSRGATLALVVAFDKSGSMEERVAGTAKIEYARQAVKSVVEMLPADDAVGVIAFDGATRTVAELAGPRDPGRLDEALRALRPEGATAIAPALVQARAWLDAPAMKAVAKKHVLLISDGQTSPADLGAAREAVRGGGFALSVVAIGAGADRAALEQLAEDSGGRAYFPDDVRQLPSTVAREATRVAGRRTVTSPFTARLAGHALTRGLQGAPQLGGYVVTSARPRAEVVLRSHLDDPLLALGRAGLGRVGVYTADLHSSWSNGFARWPGSGDLMARTLRWVARNVDDPSLFASMRGTAAGIEVVVETAAAEAPLEVTGTLRAPAGQESALVFEAVGPGRYLGRGPLGESGSYMARLTATNPDGTEAATLLRGLYWSAPQETDYDGADLRLLSSIAAATGGRVLAADTAGIEDRRAGYRDMRAWFIGLALALVLGDALAGGLARALATFLRSLGREPMGQAA